MRRRIVALLRDYPEGLTPAEIRILLGVDRRIWPIRVWGCCAMDCSSAWGEEDIGPPRCQGTINDANIRHDS